MSRRLRSVAAHPTLSTGYPSVDRQLVYRRVAQLHAENINQGFLSSLGLSFLALMYQAIDESPASTLILVRENEQVVGFVSGTLGMGLVYRQLLYHWPRLLIALAPSLLIPRRLWRMIEILRYSRGNSNHEPKLPVAELLSIVVDPVFRGRRYADRLYHQLTDFFASRGEHEFKIIVGAALAPAHRFYQRMGAHPTAEIEVHQGMRSIVYVQRLTNIKTQEP